MILSLGGSLDVQKTLRYLDLLLFLTACGGSVAREDRPEDAQGSCMVKVGWQTCLGRVAFPHGPTKGTEVEPPHLQQVLSGTTEDVSHFKKKQVYGQEAVGSRSDGLTPHHRLVSGKLSLAVFRGSSPFHRP